MTTGPSKVRRLLAAVVCVGLPALTMLGAAHFLDRPILNKAPQHADEVAALVVRDTLDPEVAFATWAVLERRFEDAYRRVTTFTLPRRFRRTPRERNVALARLLRDLFKQHDFVDIYILSPRVKDLDALIAGDGHDVKVSAEARELAPYAREKLRFVYAAHHGCDDCGRRWQRLGAWAYVGHPRDGRNAMREHAMFYLPFLRRWLAGWQLEDSVRAARRVLFRLDGYLGRNHSAKIWTERGRHMAGFQLTRPLQ